jgi:hypothetical protein
VARHLSDQWLDALARLTGTDTGRPELDGRIQVVVSDTPGGTVVWHLVIEGGTVTSVGAGKIDDPGLEISETWPDSVARWRGERSRPVEYMQGDLKTSGSTGDLLAFFGVVENPVWTHAVADLLGDTDWSS